MKTRFILLVAAIAVGAIVPANAETDAIAGWTIRDEKFVRFMECVEATRCGRHAVVSYQMNSHRSGYVDDYKDFEVRRFARYVQQGEFSDFRIIAQNSPRNQNNMILVGQYYYKKKSSGSEEYMTTALFDLSDRYISFTSTAEKVDDSMKNLSFWANIVLSVLARQSGASGQP